MQELNIIYEWAEEKLMELTEEKFKQVCYEKVNDVIVTLYKG